MNYLAHLYLSGNDNELKIGNFIADHVKGKMFYTYPDGIQRGILLHRKIDAFTDNHPLVKQGISRLRYSHGKYAGVVIDMYYDHFLAANWQGFSTEKLQDFTSKAYVLLMRNFFKLPPRTRILLPFILKNDWLASYRDLNFLARAFKGMSRRTPFESNLSNAVEDLVADYQQYKNDFETFFPEMQSFVETERMKLLTTGF
ncbi:MAG: ACP phosphodiesterase [Bacteroidota bacterium]